MGSTGSAFLFVVIYPFLGTLGSFPVTSCCFGGFAFDTVPLGMATVMVGYGAGLFCAVVFMFGLNATLLSSGTMLLLRGSHILEVSCAFTLTLAISLMSEGPACGSVVPPCTTATYLTGMALVRWIMRVSASTSAMGSWMRSSGGMG